MSAPRLPREGEHGYAAARRELMIGTGVIADGNAARRAAAHEHAMRIGKYASGFGGFAFGRDAAAEDAEFVPQTFVSSRRNRKKVPLMRLSDLQDEQDRRAATQREGVFAQSDVFSGAKRSRGAVQGTEELLRGFSTVENVGVTLLKQLGWSADSEIRGDAMTQNAFLFDGRGCLGFAAEGEEETRRSDRELLRRRTSAYDEEDVYADTSAFDSREFARDIRADGPREQGRRQREDQEETRGLPSNLDGFVRFGQEDHFEKVVTSIPQQRITEAEAVEDASYARARQAVGMPGVPQKKTSRFSDRGGSARTQQQQELQQQIKQLKEQQRQQGDQSNWHRSRFVAASTVIMPGDSSSGLIEAPAPSAGKAKLSDILPQFSSKDDFSFSAKQRRWEVYLLSRLESRPRVPPLSASDALLTEEQLQIENAEFAKLAEKLRPQLEEVGERLLSDDAVHLRDKEEKQEKRMKEQHAMTAAKQRVYRGKREERLWIPEPKLCAFFGISARDHHAEVERRQERKPRKTAKVDDLRDDVAEEENEIADFAEERADLFDSIFGSDLAEQEEETKPVEIVPSKKHRNKRKERTLERAETTRPVPVVDITGDGGAESRDDEMDDDIAEVLMSAEAPEPSSPKQPMSAEDEIMALLKKQRRRRLAKKKDKKERRRDKSVSASAAAPSTGDDTVMRRRRRKKKFGV
ncbi:MAG: hypothetical protein MHM6MM_003169 [Cercozoa sp. M6MM]